MKSLPDFFVSNHPLSWKIKKDSHLNLGAGGILSVCQDICNSRDQGRFLNSAIGDSLTVTWRNGGERCTPYGRQHSQTLKKLLQEYRLETWLRDRVPLIYSGDELVAVGDLWVCKNHVAAVGKESFKFHWKIN